MGKSSEEEQPGQDPMKIRRAPKLVAKKTSTKKAAADKATAEKATAEKVAAKKAPSKKASVTKQPAIRVKPTPKIKAKRRGR